MVARSDRRAINSLLELVRNPRPRPAQEVVGHDWTRLPRIEALGFAAMDPMDFLAVAATARAFLIGACTALDISGRDRSDASHPLDILCMHNLEEGATWDSIIAFREETGLPRLSPRTLRNRQNEAVTLLLEWASKPLDQRAHVGESAAPAERVLGPSRKLSPRLAIVVVLSASILAAILVVALRSSSDSILLTGADRQFLGCSLTARLVEPGESEPQLWEFMNPDELPSIDGEYHQATITEEGKRQYVYLGSAKGGADHTTVLKWDPAQRKILWKHRLNPPIDERWTHEGVLREPMDRVVYEIRWLAAGVSPGRETRSIAVVLWSRYSPTFVYLLDRESGEELGRYVHPGVIFSPIVVDLDGDGRGEYVMGGVDNSREMPAFVILKDSGRSSAASDVLWNEEGTEGAHTRILFPDVPELRTKLQYPHEYVFDVTPEHFNSKTGCFHLGVGSAAKKQSIYLADVYFTAGAVDSVRVRFAECHVKLWSSFGMSLEQARALIEPKIEVLRSPHDSPSHGAEPTGVLARTAK